MPSPDLAAALTWTYVRPHQRFVYCVGLSSVHRVLPCGVGSCGVYVSPLPVSWRVLPALLREKCWRKPFTFPRLLMGFRRSFQSMKVCLSVFECCHAVVIRVGGAGEAAGAPRSLLFALEMCVLLWRKAMQKLRPLMNSLKQACGYDRSWAPAVHQLLHKILATVSLHTRPLQKLFCPCCTSHKNRVLFGHYYNNDTLVCKRT